MSILPALDLLKDPVDNEREEAKPAKEVKEDPKPKRHTNSPIFCSKCGNVITFQSDRIQIAGKHKHVFVNPGGFVYRLNCFSHAIGTINVGSASNYWTWFPGYHWQQIACHHCQEHIGWIYRGADSVFFGLIEDKLNSPN